MNYTLITGASGGIGLALAKEFASHGHHLILVARNHEKLEQIAKELSDTYKVKTELVSCDLSVEEARLALFETTQSNGWNVEILVNNAGFGDANAFLDGDWKRHQNMIDLNVVALLQLSYLYGNEMRKNGNGRILNLSSVAAFSAGPYMPLYYATKGFVLSVSEAMAEELRGTGVTVSALCPGPTATGFEKNANMNSSKMFTAFGAEKAEDVARKGYRGLMKGEEVIYHGKVTYGFNLVSRFCTRKFTRRVAMKLN